MKLSIIVAASRNNAIGNKNELIYRLPNDLKRFKALTTGHSIVMGRKTFESLPKGALPNRRNIVLSTDRELTYENTEVYTSLNEVIDQCNGEEEVFIIGGDKVYKQTLKLANKIYLTRIDHETKEADAYLEEIDPAVWKEIGREDHPADEKHLYPYSFIDYERR